MPSITLWTKKLLLLFAGILAVAAPSFSQLEWPQVTRQAKPWTRWWWMGSAVNEKDLAATMEQYQKAGLGGLEITPIYGVKGYEDQFEDYLSPEWVKMLTFTLKEAKQLDLGIDMATGTGWPFGGPQVTAPDACNDMVLKIYTLQNGERLDQQISYNQEPLVRAIGHKVKITELVEPIERNQNLQALALDQARFEKPLPLQALMAYSDKGEKFNLTGKVDANGRLDWIAPAGTWILYALFQGWHGKMVERAAPGGEGNVIDHFSETALKDYLGRFDRAYKGFDVETVRAYFNDSYEVDDAIGQANFTPKLFAEFKKRRGYDLLHCLPALFGNDSEENNLRVRCDYRETISELLLEEFTIPWRKWAEGKGAIIRDQAHGSPANILDLYAASDIPETEGADEIGIKFASSAAHVTGRQLTSSESATWLDEHFCASLADVKKAVDRYFLMDVNHIFYHGTPYSPQDAPWPGWLFYAAVHFGPTNSFWNDFPALNHYVARCQSFLQSGKPDNQILLYYPFYDFISQPGKELLVHFAADESRRDSTSAFRAIAGDLLDRGYSFDCISDAQIRNLSCVNEGIEVNDASYQILIVPYCRYMPVQTLAELLALARNGTTIITHQNLPTDVPGFHQFEKRRTVLKNLIRQLVFQKINDSENSQAPIGKGKILLGQNIGQLLNMAGVEKETMIDFGLKSISRKLDDGKAYFILNRGKTAVDGWVPIQTNAGAAAIFNPINDSIGLAALKSAGNGAIEVYLQLEPGEAVILRTFARAIAGPSWLYLKSAGESQPINGPWQVSFVEGGRKLPAALTTDSLHSWTEFGDEALNAFSGTALNTVTFQKPEGKAVMWMLDLGRVAESASLTLNSKEIGIRFAAPFTIVIPDSFFKATNVLEIKVSNLMANRIAEMDRRGINYKIFYNVNFPARKRENIGEDGLFTAAKWPPRESGLIGPVTLTPLEIVQP